MTVLSFIFAGTGCGNGCESSLQIDTVLLIKCFTSSGIKDIFVANTAGVLAGGVPVLQFQGCEGYLAPHVIAAVRLTLALLTVISFVAVCCS